MALAFVTSAKHVATAASQTVVTISPALGDLVIIGSGQIANNTSTLTVSDNSSGAGNTYTQTVASYATPSGTAKRAAMFWSVITDASITTITCAWNGGISTTVDGMVFEFSGSASSSLEDTSINSFNNSTVSSSTSGTYTTANANDVLVYMTCEANTYTSPSAGSGYTIPTNGSSTNGLLIMSYDIVSATQAAQTTTHSWSTAHSYVTAFGAFKAAGAAAVVTGWPFTTAGPSYAI